MSAPIHLVCPYVINSQNAPKYPKIPNHQRPRCAILIHSAKEEPCPRERERERARPKGTKQHSYSTWRMVMRGRKEELDVCFLISFTVRSSFVHDRDERFRKCRARSVLGFVKTKALASRLAMVQRSGRNSKACMAERGVAEQPTFFNQTGTQGNAIYWGYVSCFFYVFFMFFHFLLSGLMCLCSFCPRRSLGVFVVIIVATKFPARPAPSVLYFYIFYIFYFFDCCLYCCIPLMRMWFRFVCFFMFCIFCCVVLIFSWLY